MLPRDPDFFRELFELGLGRPRFRLGGELDADAERGPLVARGPLDVGGRETRSISFAARASAVF